MDVCYCGAPIPTDGPTDLYCSQSCQARWLQQGHDPIPTPVRPEWRMGSGCRCGTQGLGQHQCAPPTRWPDPPPEPRRRLDRPSYRPGRAPAQTDWDTAYDRVNELVQQTPEQFRETAEAAKTLGDQLPSKTGIIRRIRNARKGNR